MAFAVTIFVRSSVFPLPLRGKGVKYRKLQPLFRILEKVDKSEFVGLCFSLAYLIGVVVGWYWVCFKDGADLWKAGIVSWNKQFGINLEWIPPFAFKVFATVFLVGSILGLYLVLIAKIAKH
jgi:hypothetical protein